MSVALVPAARPLATKAPVVVLPSPYVVEAIYLAKLVPVLLIGKVVERPAAVELPRPSAAKELAIPCLSRRHRPVAFSAGRLLYRRRTTVAVPSLIEVVISSVREASTSAGSTTLDRPPIPRLAKLQDVRP